MNLLHHGQRESYNAYSKEILGASILYTEKWGQVFWSQFISNALLKNSFCEK